MSELRSNSHPRPDLTPLRERILSLHHRPLLLCCVALIFGMTAAATAHPGILAFAFVMLGAGIVVAASAFFAPRMAISPLLIGAFALGGLVYEHATAVPATDLSHLAGRHGLVLEGTVIAPPDERGWQRRVRIEVRDERLTGRAEVRMPREPELAVGERVRLIDVAVELPEAPEEPGEFDRRAWLARQGVRSVVSAREVDVIGADRSITTHLIRFGTTLRARVVEAIEDAMPGADGPFYTRLLVGMVYGLEAAPLPEEVVEQFRRAGTVHLLVVSGAQVSMLAITIVGLTGGSVRTMRWWQALLASAGVLVLVLIVGMEASVGRAVSMFALVILAALTRRDYDVYTAVALAAAVILLADPQALVSLSFQLTFAATMGVIIFLPDDAIRRIDDSVAERPLPQVRAVIWGTLGAWAMTTPLLAHSFSSFVLSGNVANFANVPLSAVVLALGFVALPMALVPQLAPFLTLVCMAARGVLGAVMRVNELAAGLPVPVVDDVRVEGWAVAAWYAAVLLVVTLGLLGRAHRALDEALLRPHPSSPPVVGMVLLSALVCTMVAVGARPDGLEMTLLPVGAGQCAVIRAPGGSTLMVDCGGGGNSAGTGDELADGVIVPWLARRKIEYLSAVAVTHWDTDHCNALARTLSLIPADMLLTPPELPGAHPPEALRGGIGAKPIGALGGGRMQLGDDVRVDVLAPRMPLIRSSEAAANANSVVMMVTMGGTRILLTGDIEEAGATRLVRDARNAGRSLRADVLVLPHHGRHLEEVAVLLDAVRPRWAIASCDDAADDYLGEEQMALLTARGIRLLRTDDHGAVTVRTDGQRVRLNSSRGPHSLGSRVAAARR